MSRFSIEDEHGVLFSLLMLYCFLLFTLFFFVEL